LAVSNGMGSSPPGKKKPMPFDNRHVNTSRITHNSHLVKFVGDAIPDNQPPVFCMPLINRIKSDSRLDFYPRTRAESIYPTHCHSVLCVIILTIPQIMTAADRSTGLFLFWS
jgi:hypothetical protein